MLALLASADYWGEAFEVFAAAVAIAVGCTVVGVIENSTTAGRVRADRRIRQIGSIITRYRFDCGRVQSMPE